MKKEELEELLNGGKLKIDDRPFGWLTLLPCKTETTIEEINGEAFVAVKVGKDIFSPLDSLLASFIFPNEKEITLTFGEASATDVVKITPVSLFSRIWRWLVILAILLFILHLVLYIIGFFAAKKLPTGVILEFSLNPGSSRLPVDVISETKVNIAAIDLIKWHLFRFIPFMEFRNQSSVSNGTVEFGYLTKTGGAKFRVQDEPLVKQQYYSDGFEDARKLDDYISAWKSYKSGMSEPFLEEITSKNFAGLFEERDSEPVEQGKTCSAGWYAVYDEKNRIERMVTFVSSRY